MRHSLGKQPRGPWRKQAEMGAADHSSHSESSTETVYKLNGIKTFGYLLLYFYR